MRPGLLAALAVLAATFACRSPLADLRPDWREPVLQVAVGIEDHSRKLENLEEPAGAPDTAESRHAALERHRARFEEAFRAEAARRGLRLDPAAGLRLELQITSLGEVRAKYIAWGIASGVAWGVATGLVSQSPELAVALGAYELVEETAFWVGGAVLMGRWSSPAVVEAKLVRSGQAEPVWESSYYELWASRELEAYPPEARKLRQNQLQASLGKVMAALFRDLEAIPGFPAALSPSSPPASAGAAPGPPPPG